LTNCPFLLYFLGNGQNMLFEKIISQGGSMRRNNLMETVEFICLLAVFLFLLPLAIIINIPQKKETAKQLFDNHYTPVSHKAKRESAKEMATVVVGYCSEKDSGLDSGVHQDIINFSKN